MNMINLVETDKIEPEADFFGHRLKLSNSLYIPLNPYNSKSLIRNLTELELNLKNKYPLIVTIWIIESFSFTYI
jgi:hypothetical protein